MNQFCAVRANSFDSLSSKKLLFLRPYHFRSELFGDREHLVVNMIHYRTLLEPPLPLTSHPRGLFPWLDGVDPGDFVPKPLESLHAHERSLARTDFT